MRILHVISGIDAHNGGTTAALLGMTKAQIHAGMDVSIVSTWRYQTGPKNAQVFEQAGVRLHLIGPAWGPPSWHPALRRELRRLVEQADVVHIHSAWEEIQHVACRTAQRLGVPYVYTLHGMLDPWNLSTGSLKKWFYYRWRLRRNLQRAAVVHAASDMEKRHLLRLAIGTQIEVEPFGLDLSEFDDAVLPAPGSFRRRYPQIGDRPIILFLGRLHRGKGLEFLIPAFAQLIYRAGSNAGGGGVFVIAGPDGGYRAQAEREVHRLGIAERTIFTGMLRGRERIEALVDATLLAAPSLHENFGLAIAEALAAGTPVVVSDQVGLADVIQSHNFGGVCYPAADPVADQLHAWLTHPNRTETGHAARKYMLRWLNWAHIAQRWKMIYSTICRSTRGR